jgi:hypothetical protein
MIEEEDLKAIFPRGVPAPPGSDLSERLPSLGDKLRHNTSLALDRQRELLELGIDPKDHRQNRIVADVAQATVKTSLQAETNALQAQRDDVLKRVIEILKVEARAMGLIEDRG